MVQTLNVIRLSFISALLCALALVARTIFFAFEFHNLHSANVIGWPFAFAMFKLALLGTIIGVPLSGFALHSAEREHQERKLAQVGLALNCLLLPLAFFLVFPFPYIFLHSINFD